MFWGAPTTPAGLPVNKVYSASAWTREESSLTATTSSGGRSVLTLPKVNLNDFKCIVQNNHKYKYKYYKYVVLPSAVLSTLPKAAFMPWCWVHANSQTKQKHKQERCACSWLVYLDPFLCVWVWESVCVSECVCVFQLFVCNFIREQSKASSGWFISWGLKMRDKCHRINNGKAASMAFWSIAGLLNQSL